MSNEDYAKRAAELGHGIISTAEHGWQGRYIEGYELAQKYGLKFVFGTEAYWVKDRTEKDRSNCHIYLGARNENGRQAINDVLSEANVSGYYFQPRLDVPLITSLPKDDVIITSACVAFWKYDEVEEIAISLAKHFGKNFFLEVQYHNTEKQRDLNSRILKLSAANDIPIIMGCDSHYIAADGGQDRADYLFAKGIEYPDEEGWYLDYPDGNEAYNRFVKQCVLSHNEIMQAIGNTNVFLEVEEYQNPCFTKDIKMPVLYPDLTQEQKNEVYHDLVWGKWEEEKQNIPPEEHAKYEEEIRKEIEIVDVTSHAEYFLLDYKIVERGLEKGGVITPTGRGSGVSFVTNKLLGFTEVDRVSAKVRMYPERFMSATRILETKSLADLDLNLGTPDVFAEAQEEIMGVGHSAPMIAYGTLKPPAAWKMYAKSQNIEFDLANEISQQIKKWQKAVAQAPDDERDDIDVLEYIDVQYHETYLKSVEYQGIIADFKPHPCSYLLYDGDIRREVGMIFIKPKTGEGRLCCVMDGKWAEDYKFLKNDLLKVSVAEMISKVYKRIGIKQHKVSELLEICTPDNKAWDVYARGCTMGVNQVEQRGTSQRVMKYKPTNITELCAFIAAIRPGFKSMYKVFESRKHFDYGIKSFDDLIQTPEMPNTFVLYQEMSMATLNYAGIPMSECYEIIKNIAKKRVDKVLAYKEQFLTGFSRAIVEKENKTQEEADELAHKVWKILEDSSAYSFNSSHSYCVSIDSLYCAYLKSHYPLEFYEVFLTILQEKGAKTRMAETKEEAESYYGIRFPPYRFGQDNRNITADHENHAINNSLAAIKGFGSNICEVLYEAAQHAHTTFMNLLKYLNSAGVKSSKIIPLIKIDYFMEFGNIQELLRLCATFDFLKQGEAKEISKGKVPEDLVGIIGNYATDRNKNGSEAKAYKLTDIHGLMAEYEKSIKSLCLPDEIYQTKMKNQLDLLGYVDLTSGKKEDRRKLLIMNVFPLVSKVDGEPWAYSLQTRSIGTGNTARLTTYRKLYDKCPVIKTDIINAIEVKKNNKGYWYLYDYEKV